MGSTQFDCSKLLVDFTTCPPGTKLTDHFSELRAFEAFTQQQDENIIRIAILTADADSPFWKLRSDRDLMIKSIFEFLDIGMKNLIGQNFYQRVLDYKHEAVASCWLAYLQMQYEIDFTDWVITKETYDLLISESGRQRGETEDVIAYANWRMKLRTEIRKYGDDLKLLEPKIFKDSKMARPVAIEQIKKIKNYPEKHAIKDSLM